MFRRKNKRRTYNKRRRRGAGIGAYISPQIAKVLIIVLIALVFAVGVSVPLFSYYSDKEILNISESDNVEYFTEEQRAELLRVVNRGNPLDSSYVPSLEETDGILVNFLMVKSLNKMLEDAEKDGVHLKLKSGYISYEEQSELFREKYNAYIQNDSISAVKAEAKTVRTTPRAGQSEAQTGLLAEFYDADESDFEKSKSFVWLGENSAEYGFVLRFPKEKQSVTAMDYSPSVYRFTGRKNAMQMRIFGMCLEEYKDYLSQK